MITGELKNRIDSLWEIFWTGGLTNPLDVICDETCGSGGFMARAKNNSEVIWSEQRSV